MSTRPAAASATLATLDRQQGRRRVGACRPGLYAASIGLLLLARPVAAADVTPASATARPATPDRIAVMPLEILGEVPAGRPALEAAVLRGLTVAAAPTLPVNEAEARMRSGTTRLPCENADCWSAIGRVLDARYLITGKVERKANLFQVEFKLIDARPGRLLAVESNGCPADDCSVAELCRLVVRELARKTLAQPESPTSSGPSAPTEAERLPSQATVIDTARRPAPADRGGGPSSTRKKWALAALLGGVAAAGAGGYLIYYHHSCAARFGDTGECIRLRGSDKNEALIGGIAAAGAGAGLVATGVVLLLTGRTGAPLRADSGVSVSLLPGGLTLSGRF